MNLFNWDELQIFTFFFVLIRVTSLIFFLPIYGDRNVPSVLKILFGLAFAFIAFPIAWTQGVRLPEQVMSSMSHTLWAVAADILFGVMVGFSARWIFDAVQFAGHFAGTSIGFSIATVLDPHTESHTIALAELQYLMAVLLFLAMDGHHIYLSAILKSFEIVRLGGVDMFAHDQKIIEYLIAMTSNVILLGLKLCAPVFIIILLLNITFGILNRAVPQLNVMSISFSVNIVLGLFVALISMPGFVNMVGAAFDSYTPEIYRFMRLFGG